MELSREEFIKKCEEQKNANIFVEHSKEELNNATYRILDLCVLEISDLENDEVSKKVIATRVENNYVWYMDIKTGKYYADKKEEARTKKATYYISKRISFEQECFGVMYGQKPHIFPNTILTMPDIDRILEENKKYKSGLSL